MKELIRFANENSGFFSLFLSLIAIIVSVFAISSQNKIAKFEKRLALFEESKEIYDKLKKIVEICNDRPVNEKCNLINFCIFGLYGKESEMGKQLIKVGDKLRQSPTGILNFEDGDIRLADQWAAEHIKPLKYSGSPLYLSDIYYSRKISTDLYKLYDKYYEIRLSFWEMKDDELNSWLIKTKDVILSIDHNNLFREMQKRLKL